MRYARTRFLLLPNDSKPCRNPVSSKRSLGHVPTKLNIKGRLHFRRPFCFHFKLIFKLFIQSSDNQSFSTVKNSSSCFKALPSTSVNAASAAENLITARLRLPCSVSAVLRMTPASSSSILTAIPAASKESPLNTARPRLTWPRYWARAMISWTG